MPVNIQYSSVHFLEILAAIVQKRYKQMVVQLIYWLLLQSEQYCLYGFTSTEKWTRLNFKNKAFTRGRFKIVRNHIAYSTGKKPLLQDYLVFLKWMLQIFWKSIITCMQRSSPFSQEFGKYLEADFSEFNNNNKDLYVLSHEIRTWHSKYTVLTGMGSHACVLIITRPLLNSTSSLKEWP